MTDKQHVVPPTIQALGVDLLAPLFLSFAVRWPPAVEVLGHNALPRPADDLLTEVNVYDSMRDALIADLHALTIRVIIDPNVAARREVRELAQRIETSTTATLVAILEQRGDAPPDELSEA
jgi:hypothetical protein